jgi:hypothetical protein
MNPECHTDLWDQLEQALALQAQYLQQGKWRDLESSLGQTQDLVSRILQDGPAQGACSEPRVERLRQLYDRLTLMGAAHQHTLGQQLQRLRCGKRTIRAYQGRRR